MTKSIACMTKDRVLACLLICCIYCQHMSQCGGQVKDLSLGRCVKASGTLPNNSSVVPLAKAAHDPSYRHSDLSV